MKKAGKITAGETFGEIESVKATSELYSGVTGEIIELNQQAVDSPELVSQDPYGKGWMIRIKVADTAQLNELHSAADYDKAHG
jgi:glycine cleavage system H protein